MTLIASRTLQIHKNGKEHDFDVRLFKPEYDGSAWKCTYEIDWPDKPIIQGIYGADAFQAIELATQMIGVRLYTSQHHETGSLVWANAPGCGYGFPVTKTLRDMLIGDDKREYG